MDGWMDGWMDGTQGTAARRSLPLRHLREPPQASSAGFRQRFEVPDWPSHASIHELPSARTEAESQTAVGLRGREHRGQE